MASKLLWLVVGLALFAIILSRLDTSAIAALLQNTDKFWIVIGLLCVAGSIVIKAAKWRLILRSAGISLDWILTIRLYVIGFFVGLVTPGRIGDFSRAIYLKHPLPVTLAGIFFDRLFEVITLFALGLFGAAAFVQVYHQGIVSAEIWLLLLVLFGLLVLAVWKTRLWVEAGLRFFQAVLPLHWREKVRGHAAAFTTELERLFSDKRLVRNAGLLSFFNLFFAVGLGVSIINALHLSAPLLFLVLTIPVIILLDILPISVAGIGIRDAVLTYAFSIIGLGGEEAVAFSLLFLGLGYVSVAAVGVLFFAQEPEGLKKKLTQAV